MLNEGKIWIGTGTDKKPVYLLPQMANRHGLIAGATGTGKTVTLKVLAEGFSSMGVPVFLGDIKGDLSGMIKPGMPSEKIDERLKGCGVTEGFSYQSYPTVFWDVYGEQGHPIRTSVKEMGPLLLSRMLNLNETQAGVLNILFRVSDAESLPLITVQDIRAMLVHLGDNASEYTLNYGNISKASVGAIQRALGLLEDQGGDVFFGEPALKIADWMQQNNEGKGFINILACDRLFQNPLMYSTFLLWMLTELYDSMPEVGDLEKPRMVFFFDEAHLLFDDCPKQLMEKIEQIVRLIRSKGIGVYFITQNPSDVPSNVLSQLNNRVQHALRAYTPLDQKGVKVAAQTFRSNPTFSTEAAISRLKTGEALVSLLDENGAPSMVSRATILPPQSYMNAITPEERRQFIESSPLYGKYEEVQPKEGAYVQLNEQNVSTKTPPAAPIVDSEMIEAFKRYATAGKAYAVNTFGLELTNPQNEFPQVPTLDETRAELAAADALSSNETNLAGFDPVNILLEDTTTNDHYIEKECPAMTNDNNNPQAMQLQIQQLQAQLQQQQLQQQQLLQQLQQQTATQPAVPQPQQVVMPQTAAPVVPVQQPVYPMQPVQPVQPSAAIMADQAQTVQQTVMVLDPESGAYVQKTLTMVYDAASGQYYPVQTEKEAKAAAAAKEKAEKEAARLEKQEEAEARRARAAELREESAARARANNSILGRVKNTAVQSATRTVTNTLTKSLMNLISGKKK